MILTEADMKVICGKLFEQHFELAHAANLNRTSGAAILGVSASRYNQIRKESHTVVQAHVFVNLINSNEAIKQGLSDGWLPVKASRGKPQQEAVERLGS